MHELADDIFSLNLYPGDLVNAYLIGGVLVDAATRHASSRILRELQGRRVEAHALTHVHPDHQGSSHAVCEALDLPLWVGALEADVMESGEMEELLPRTPETLRAIRKRGGPGHPVAWRLREGDLVGGFEVLEVPGHSPGHLAFWRPRDGTLLVGDVVINHDYATGKPRLCEPATGLSMDSLRNRQSAERLARLRPQLICFGHGPPSNDTDAFIEFVDGMSGG